MISKEERPVNFNITKYIPLLMEGIRITGQNLFSQESIDSAKNKVQSLIHSKGMDLKGGPEGGYGGQQAPSQAPPQGPGPQPQSVIEADSTFNSIEVRFQPYQGGTRMEVDHGITTVGLILGIIGLFFFALGAIVFILWFLKYNETKDDLNRTFPAYMPPAQGGQPPNQPQQAPPQQGGPQ